MRMLQIPSLIKPVIKFEFSELETKEYFTILFDYSKIWTAVK